MVGDSASGAAEVQTGKTVKVDPVPGLYVHVPFCLSRCGYCAFVSGIYDEATADRYIEGIRRELSARGICRGEFFPSTVFIGGGTPSVLTPVQLDRLFSFLPLPRVGVGLGGEVTCEMNPDSATPEKLRLLYGLGVDRVSFGVQTFSERGLRLLGRRHDGDRARGVVEEAFRVGFRRVSVDLINGWPGQTEGEVAEDLRIVVGLGVEHVSCYNFILEEGASGYGVLLALQGEGEVDEEWGRRCWDVTEEWLCGRGGFEHYEVSNFARGGGGCRHNLAIWRGGEYYGVGVSACGYLGGRRYGNIDSVEGYLGCGGGDSGVGGVGVEMWGEELGGEAAARECAVFWLRLYEGVDLGLFRERTGYDFFMLYGGRIEAFLSEGVMEMVGGGRIRVCPRYMAVLDAILVDLV